MKRTTLPIVCAVLVAVAVAYLIGRGTAPVAGSNLSAPTGSARLDIADAPAVGAAATPAPPSPSRSGGAVPPPGAPLKDSFAELQAHATAGDAAAASRLVRDLDRCHRLRASQSNNATATDDLLRKSSDAMSAAQLRTHQALLDAMELRQQRVREGETLCAGVTDAMLDTLVPSIAQAARLGDDTARACYLGRGPLHDTRSLLAHPESLRSYRSDVSMLMNAGLAAGDWRVVDLLQQAYAPGSQGLLAGAVGADRVQHYRYLRLYRLGAEPHRAAKLDRQLASAASQLTPMQLADADAWAQTNLHDHFEGNSTGATPEGWDACAF